MVTGLTMGIKPISLANASALSNWAMWVYNLIYLNVRNWTKCEWLYDFIFAANNFHQLIL